MADLKTIISITQEEMKRQTPTQQVVQVALEVLKPREADVLNRRFGLRDGQIETLQHIGAEFAITRERVRQIESQGLQKFHEQLNKKPLADILKLAVTLVREHGGLMAADVLSEGFLPESQQTEPGQRSLTFLLSQAPGLLTRAEDKHFRAAYAISKAHLEALSTIRPILAGLFKQAGQPQSAAILHDGVERDQGSEGVRYLLKEVFIESVLEVGKEFVATADGSWGLASWPEVNPRTIRDKTLYILRRVGTPLHFSDITKRIEQAKFDQKNVTVQAVHNELINGDEFVLIGRGIYALADWGYIPGTVADVIRSVLKKAKTPLDREEIVKEVLKQRHVSRNTILINLQEKSKFVRVSGHSYKLTG